jgi:uncharacterized RDD family membrane protein YckC
MAELITAAPWRRGVAALLDGALGALVWLWSSMCVVAGVWGFRSSPLELEDAVLLAAAILVLGIVLHIVYHVGFVGGCGQTPGRMALGIAVVRRDGEAVGPWRALLRCLGGALSLPTLGLANAGVLFTRERRGFADWLAGTRVVRAARVPRAARDRRPLAPTPPRSDVSSGTGARWADSTENRTASTRAHISEEA